MKILLLKSIYKWCALQWEFKFNQIMNEVFGLIFFQLKWYFISVVLN